MSIERMTETELIEEEERLKKMFEAKNGTRQDAFRLHEVRTALETIWRVKRGESPLRQ